MEHRSKLTVARKDPVLYIWTTTVCTVSVTKITILVIHCSKQRYIVVEVIQTQHSSDENNDPKVCVMHGQA